MARCDLCRHGHARWRYTAATEPPEWNACDTCHILIGNGWWLSLADRSRDVGGDRFGDLTIDRNRRFVALEDGSLAAGGTWHGYTVPLGWRLDESHTRWLPPNVRALMESSSSWPRIADDLRRSTGRELVLRDVSDLGEAEAGWVNIEVYLDGAALGSFRHGGHSPDVEVFITELADDLTEFVHDKRISGAWPTCPDHGTDPVEADAIDGVACWRCPVDGRVVSVIGSLGSA